MLTKQIILNSRPKGKPIADNFKFEKIELSEIQKGEVLLKSLYYSVDPYMRNRMNDTKSYTAPFQIGLPIEGGVLAIVLDSKSDRFKKDDIVLGFLPWRMNIIVSEKVIQKIEDDTLPLSYYLGILGMTGLTAYFGLIQICKPKVGETVIVSGAAGAVGIVVGQLAKIHGCRTIGITGSDEKIKILKDEFGFDEAINYKTTSDLRNLVGGLCTNGIDIYFDNVGGSISDEIMTSINNNARIAICGQISLYNSTVIPMGPRLQPILLTRTAMMKGFLVGNFQSQYPEVILKLSDWIKEGKLKYKETIIEGFDFLPSAFIGLFNGDNIGKMIVKA